MDAVVYSGLDEVQFIQCQGVVPDTVKSKDEHKNSVKTTFI